MKNSGGNVINVTQLIDDGPVTAYQVTAIALCSAVAFLDGLDSLSIAVAAPIIVDKLRLAPATLGLIFSAGLLGAMVGALTFGPLSDRFGRKRILIIAATIFGIFTLATSWAQSYETLLAARFLTGLGLGGAAPCFLALASEYAPRRHKGMVVSLIWAAFPLGGAVGGFINAYILSNFGWETIFTVGGLLPLAIATALLMWLPESIRFLIAKGADHKQIAGILANIIPTMPANPHFVADESRADGSTLKHLFEGGRALDTLLLWAPFFTSFGTLALVVYWMPALLRHHEISLTHSSIVIGVNSFGALIGMASAGWLIDRFGAAAVLFPAFVLGALATGGLGFAASSVISISVILSIVGLSVGLAASGSIALAALTYPTAIRSSGIGWAMGMGRFGQVLAPLFAGALTAAGWGDQNLFLAVALAPLAGALAILALRWRSGSTLIAEDHAPILDVH